MKEGSIIQIAHVVRDIDKTMKYYWETFGLGPWEYLRRLRRLLQLR